MKENINEIWIFAALQDGIFYPESISNLESLDNLEYADVRDGEYQLWHWPTGDIFTIESDREVKPREEYSVPYSNEGVVWLPILKKVSTDKARVEKALKSLDK